MARRRHKQPNRRPAEPKRRQPRDRNARVRVSDEIWAEFSAAETESLNRRLGELVEREVERHRAKRIRQGSFDDVQIVALLERARRQQDESVRQQENLEGIVARLERAAERSAERRAAAPQSDPSSDPPPGW